LHTFDKAWQARALAGEEAAVKELTSAVLGPLYRFCLYRVGRNQHWCEEVVQETLLRALGELDRYDPDRASGNILAWLTGLARNEIQRTLTREKNASLQTLWARMDRDLLAVYGRMAETPFDDQTVEREETRELVNAAMAQLPDHYREALEKKYVDGQSVRDLAQTWKVTEKAVESMLTRARQAFRMTFMALTKNLGTELA